VVRPVESHQLIGALMHLPARNAEPILALVPDTAIGRPLARWVYEVIRGLVKEGRDPDSVLMLCTAKHRPAARALHPEQRVTAERHRAFAVYLADAYTQTVSPAAAQAYACEVLDGAYRRAFGEYGIRMQQMAESGASRDDLTDQFTLIRDELGHPRVRHAMSCRGSSRTRRPPGPARPGYSRGQCRVAVAWRLTYRVRQTQRRSGGVAAALAAQQPASRRRGRP